MNVAGNAGRGRFLVIDGIDGCGKTTQAGLLAHALRAESAREVQHLREPGSTAVGERLRETLLSREHELSPAVETLLFAAARRAMLDELVEPALARGEHVVCERFHASTFAYQAVAGGLAEREVLALLDRWAGAPKPDLVLWLDLPVERAALRLAPRMSAPRGREPAAPDRIEAKGPEFQRRVAAGYRRYAELVPGVVRIDADRSADEVAAAILAEVRRAL